MILQKSGALLIAFIIGSSLLGCALTDQQKEEDNQPPLSNSTSAELFQKRCDESMLQAAVARWKEGDVAGCRMLLERLLNRNPGHLHARLLLADLHSSHGNIPDAEAQLRWIVQHHPNNPQARHSLGLLLETSGRRDEAIAHLQAAAQLEPTNELYVMCHNAAAAGAGTRY